MARIARAGVLLAALLVLALGAGLAVSPPALAAGTLPGYPADVQAVPGTGSITITWSAAPDGGSPITGYLVASSSGALGSTVLPADARSHTVHGLHGGIPYRACVYALNANGGSEGCQLSPTVTLPAEAPGVPQQLQLAYRWDGAVRVSWQFAEPYGAPISGFTLTENPDGARAFVDTRAWDAAPPDPDGSRHYFVDLRGLRTGVEHSVSVTATNAMGTGPAASETFELESLDEMVVGETLFPGEELRSANGRYSLEMQQDGNLVVYADDIRPLWHTHKWRPGTELDLQYDGNLVAYGTDGFDVWNSGTFGNRYSRLVIQDDGNLVLYGADGRPLWFTGWDRGTVQDTLLAKQDLTAGQSLVSRNGQYQALMQADGNLVVYGPGRRALWHIGVWNRGGNRLRIQADGNAVVYQFNWLMNWHAGTWGNANVRLLMQDDGNLVLYAANGRALWSSMFGRTY
ncbi:fibronectin type III domain-containing protein [Modestobacter sp. SSW1-42]|uniref:fibronectin type III domain-containing protein n=1 Tax=Modestobacter sp. SSW1-42 TaxID=596372 RepID=UPI003985F8C0